MNKNKGNLEMYLKWPVFVAVYFAIVTLLLNIVSTKASYLLGFFVLIFAFLAFYLSKTKFNNLKPSIMKEIENLAKVQGLYLSKINIPIAATDVSGKIVWGNEAFFEIGKNAKVGIIIGDIFSDLNAKILESINDTAIDLLTSYDDKKYKVHINSMDLTQSNPNSQLRSITDDDKIFIHYFYNQTEYYELKQEYLNNKQVTGFIYIDNYYEVAENLEDSKASMLIAMVDRKLTRYISYNKGILKKLEKDKYFFVTTHKDIEDMILDRFSILEQTKDIIGGDNIPLTLSIGVGYDGKSIESNHELARVAIDMALGRGGDQAVVKRGQETLFFGGKSASTSTNVRVRSRVKATSFKETLDMKDKVLIMGHKNGDLDSFGASVGTYVMARHLGKDVHIVVNSLTNACEEMKQRFMSSELSDKSMFMTGDEALNFADNNTLLIIVDHNLSAISDEPRLFDMGLDLVVFDHHRVSANSVTDAILSYVDASASSTCELVTEIMIYFEDRIKLKQYEADSILGGMMLDTMSFTYQTSAKTFDAAAFIKKKGADTDRVRKILRVDMAFEKLKNEIVSKAELYKDSFSIAILSEISEDIEESVAKAVIANELINIKGVKASIVISREGNNYLLSSRSIDEVNVQVLMEKLGGGGHRSMAGATISADSFEDVVKLVKEKIDEMLNEEVSK